MPDAAEARARHALRAAVEDAGAHADVEQAVALVVPDELRSDQSALAERIGDAPFTFCLISRHEDEHEATRWPARGWLRGDAAAIADLIERAAVSERMIARGLEVLENSVRNATGTLRGQLDRPGISALGEIAEVLRQEDGEQTTRMAVTIIANALTVHDGVASAHESVPSLAEAADGGPIGKEQTLAAWERILVINYWPIFEVARDLLTCIPAAEAGNLIEDLRAAADEDELARLGITTTQDLAGQMFGRLIADRKFLATFYTRPASAALLAELAAARLDVDWSDPEAVKALRVADWQRQISGRTPKAKLGLPS